jgi:Ca2+-binding RTX toxin-like protein
VPSAARSALATVVSTAVLVTYGVAAATPARAVGGQDAATAGVVALFTRLATDVLPQTASGSAVSQQLPTVAVTAAESVGLKTAFKDALATGGQLDGVATQKTLSELDGYLEGADGGGWTFDSTLTGQSLTLGFTRELTTDAGLDLRDPDGTISLSSGKGIDVVGTLTGSFTFVAGTGQASLTKPALAISTTAELPDDSTLDAGLGILGVAVNGTDSSYALQSTVTTTWANPDDDAAGALAFDDPGTTTPDDGELAADGAGSGLVTAVRTGTLSGSLNAEPRDVGTVANLPAVGATISVSSTAPGASFEMPTVSSVVPVAAQPFLTMTPRDLAAALSQAGSAVLGMQDAEEARLPLMRGTLGNAIDAVGGIKAFLAEQVPDADPDDETPGQPKFASLQDMLKALDAAAYTTSGWSLDVLPGASYDVGSKKVDFTLTTTRAGVAGLELNLLGEATTGRGTAFRDKGLDASGVDFDGPKGASGAELAGRKVTAGLSYGTIAEVVDGNTLLLTDDGWSAGLPAVGTDFSVEAADPKTGAPEFADALQDDTGIEVANADLSTATVTPDVVLTLPLALDLRAPLTFAADATKRDCNPDSAVESACPFKQVDASGLGRVITSLPLAADRVLLRQSDRAVLVANADITSPVQIHTSSGFLALTVGGTVTMTRPTEGHLQTLRLKGSGDIPMPAFVEAVRKQAEKENDFIAVFSQSLAGSVTAALDISVDDAPDAFAKDVDSTRITVTGTVAKLADGSIDKDDVTVTAREPARASLLSALNFEPENPESLFGGVQGAFRAAGSDLTTMTGGGLDTPIPFVGSSVGQLVGAGASGAAGASYTQQAAVADVVGPPAVEGRPATTTLTDSGAAFGKEFLGRQIVVGSTVTTIVGVGSLDTPVTGEATATSLVLAPALTLQPDAGTPYLVENELLGAVRVLQAMAPATLQEAVAMAQASLGEDSTIDVGLVTSKGGDPQLRLDLGWERDYRVSRPVSLEFGEQQLVGVSGGGELSLDVSGSVNLRLLLPLTADAMLEPLTSTKVDKAASTIDVSVEVAAKGAHFGANLGPVSLDIGTTADPGTFSAGFSASAGSASTESLPSLKDFFTSGFEVGVENGPGCAEAEIVCAKFPVYVSGAKANGPLLVTATLGEDQGLLEAFSGTKVVLPQDLQNILDGTPFKFGTLIEGLQQYMFYSESALRTASNGGEMPVIGKDLQAGADFLGETREELGAFVEANGDVSSVGPAREYLVKMLSETLDLPLNGDTGLILDFTCNRELEPPAAPTATSTPATPATGDSTRYVYEVVSVYKDKNNVEHVSAPSANSPMVTNAATLVAGSKTNTVTWARFPGATSYKVLRATVTSAVGAAATTLSAFGVVGTAPAPAAGATTVSYTDSATTTTAVPAVPVKAYRLPGVPCEDEDSVTEIEGVTLQLKLGQGQISAADGCKTSQAFGECITAKLPVDLGLPGLSLKTGDGGSVSGQVGWGLDVKLGLSRTRGFYVDASKDDEFQVGAQLALDRVGGDTVPDLQAQLAIIDVDVEKKTDKPEFVGYFGIDIQDSKLDKDDDLTLTEMRSLKVADAIEVSVKATVNVFWHLEASASAALPGVSTDFRLVWTWGATTGTGAGTGTGTGASPSPSVSPSPRPTTTTPGTGTAPKPGTARPRDTAGLTVAFEHVTLNAGEFFGDALNPYLTQVVDATKPLQPILDTIFTPMPVISDLSVAAGGKPVTIASLGETFNTLPGGAKITPFLNAIKTVKKLKDGVKCSGGLTSCGVDIGSFTLLGARTATTVATTGGAKSMMGTTTPNTAASDQIAQKDASKQLASVPKATALRKGLAGLAIPVMDEPTLLFELISGGDIPLVEFDSGPLTLGFQFQKSFGPIYAPPPVMMVIGGGASVTLRVAAGFDTYGIRQAMETGDGAQVLDSLYFKTVDANGAPIPVVQFTGYLEAAASVSLGILEVGVLGGIKLTVGFYWNDPNSDGKFRLFEFSGAVATNPICLFNVGGQLSLYVKVFVVIGFSPFAVDFDFTLVNIKLLDFNLKPDCTPPPPKLGGTVGTTLYVFAGKHGETGPRGDKAWASGGKEETWVVRQVPGYTDEDGPHDPAVEVRGLGLTESFADTSEAPIDTVVVDGRGYDGALTVSFTGGSAPSVDAKPGAFTKTAVVFTGKGADVIRTGEGPSWVDAGAGDDSVTTFDRTDLENGVAATAHVAGGAGSDVISVGNGDDVVTGDGSLTVGTETTPTVTLAPGGKATTAALVSTIDPSKLTDPADDALYAAAPDGSGDDQIAAGLGAVKLSGGGGDDTLGTANDSPLADSVGIKDGTAGGSATEEAGYRAHASVLVGGAGSDSLKSGSADDALYTGAKESPGVDGAGSGDADSDSNVVDTGAGSDRVYGSNGLDVVTLHSTATQAAVAFGGGAADILTGGLGQDTLNGGPGDDYVVAAPATVGAPGSTTDVLGAARDVTVLPNAGSSRKLLVGGTGSDRIYGSDGDADIYGDTTVVDCTAPGTADPAEETVAGDAADLVIGGGGVDVVRAGGGGDWVYAAGGRDRACGSSGDDHVYGGGDDDVVQGGTGDDEAFGEAGADQVRGNADDDALYGGSGADQMQGNGALDWLDGGPEADVLLGGTSTAGTADDADVLLGAEGADVLVGDDATTGNLDQAPYPTDLTSTDAALGGGDRLIGGDGDDRGYGGLEGDTLLGGDGEDALEGGPGTDTVWGEAGDDDVIGGSSQLASGLFSGSEAGPPDARDVLAGGDGEDVVAGDNASLTRSSPGHPTMDGRVAQPRHVDLADESAGTPTGVSGDDSITGGAGADVVFAQRGTDDVALGDGPDYGEGGPGVDTVHGDGGDDDVVGGSFSPADPAAPLTGQPDGGDTLSGDAGEDVVLGDDGQLTRFTSTTTSALRTLTESLIGSSSVTAPSRVVSPLTQVRLASTRSLTAYDLGDTPVSGTSGADTITGDDAVDVLLGQGGDDSVDGGAGSDYAEGGQGSDLVLGSDDDDDLVGGSSSAGPAGPAGAAGPAGQPDGADDVLGGSGDDLVLGDNGLVTRVTTGRDWRTERPNAAQTALVPGRTIVLHDLVGPAPAAVPAAGHFGADALSGQDGVDVLFGQDGDDGISGGGQDDYAEGDGGRDVVHGDIALTLGQLVAAPAGAAWMTPAVDEATAVAGQDDLLGGWSREGYRDGEDTLDGDGSDDVVLGDNGAVARKLDGVKEVVYTQRYGAGRTGSAKVRVAGGGAPSTRFCPATGTTPTSTCEVAGASGADEVYGSDGQDLLYGQDGNDRMWGGDGDDDAYGELGDDVLWGEGGDDALLGDRGGVQNRYETGASSRSKTLSMPPAVTYTSRRAGSVSRETDLLHDVDGATLRLGATMPLDGIAYGGADRIRGGDGNDAVHGGAGDDLLNGDTGGDALFGAGGRDVVWGGLGRACAPADAACLADPGAKGEWVDHLAGGKGEDVLDWRPRGVFGSGPLLTGRTCSTSTVAVTTQKDGTTDPCTWFQMTDRTDDDTMQPATLANNQHHQGIDWVYGGWDRDVLQGDQSANGPNPGDRLIDWAGVYNLYSHCNAAYGGFNDIRILAPDVMSFLQLWATGLGAGRPGSAPSEADVLKPGTSAHAELALVTTADSKGHGTGSAYPTTPGHFDDAGACNGF